MQINRKSEIKRSDPQLRGLQPQEIEVQQNKTRSMNAWLEKIGPNGLEQPGSRRRGPRRVGPEGKLQGLSRVWEGLVRIGGEEEEVME